MSDVPATFYDGIFSKRLKLKGWNFVWCFNKNFYEQWERKKMLHNEMLVIGFTGIAVKQG